MSRVESPWIKIFESPEGASIAREARAEAVRQGLIDKDWLSLVSPLSFKSLEVAALVEDLRILEELIYDLPDRLYAGHYETFLHELRISEPIAGFLRDTYDRSARTPIRWDLIGSESGWKILELNLGCCLGGLNGFALEPFYRRLSEVSGQAKGQRIPDGFSVLVRHIRNRLGNGSDIRVALVEEDSAAEAYGFYLEALAEALRKDGGLRVLTTTLSQVGVDGPGLEVKGERIDAIIPMFTVEEMFQNRERYISQIEAIREGRLPTVVNFNEYAVSHKGILAILRNPRNWSQFSEREVHAIRRRIPETRFARDAGAWNPPEFVIKPGCEYGGSGVVCSWTAEPGEIESSLKAACAEDSAFILQERVSAQECAVAAVTTDGRLEVGLAKPVMGLITIEGQIAGGLARAILSEPNPGVVNAHQGAAMGVVTLNAEDL